VADVDTSQAKRKKAGSGLKRASARAPSGAAPDVLVAALEALHHGDFAVRLRPRDGIDADVVDAFNDLAARLDQNAFEMARITRVVVRDGEMSERMRADGLRGGWEVLADNVNTLIGDLVRPSAEVARVLTAVAEGDLSQKMAMEIDGKPVRGEFLRIGTTVNRMVDQLRAFASEVTRVAREVGTEGKLGGQAFVPGVGGTWKDLTENVNGMASNLTLQVRGIARVVTAVAKGDLSKRLVVETKGEIAELADTINDMTETLGIFADQVTTVAREVGTEGKLGGQARVPGVAGTWKDLTDSVNSMASNLTTQVRGIVKLVTAVAGGDLSQKFTMDAQGEIAALADTLNTMTDTLRAFASEVTRVAGEVGTEGRLGGQARVAGAAGTWRDLVDNVNQLADSLTSQIRAMAEVATAVTEGDLTRSITVEARGEVLQLRERVNEMIGNLRETTRQNREQDWLKSNLARFGAMMQGQKDLESVGRLIMSELTPLVQASNGCFFVVDEADGGTIKLLATYGCGERKYAANRFRLGEGIVGQAALEKKSILMTRVPPDYVVITSGLGHGPPLNILVLPVLFEDEVRAIVELASFEPFSPVHRAFLEQLSEGIGVVLNTIAANMRTEDLLAQSLSLAEELKDQSRELQQQQDELRQSNQELADQAQTLRASEELLRQQQEELQQVNEELEEKASLLVEQNKAVEQKNREVELARIAVEQEAAELALSSRYKSEFLANMSHELRTPLNSLLILARMLEDNKEGNLSDKQIEYATTIHSAGADLLDLINEVLDLSKVEAGKIEIEPCDVSVLDVVRYVDQSFRHVAQQKGLAFAVDVDGAVPPMLRTDGQRLQQILRNLLGNAFKFTETGAVRVRVERAPVGNLYQSVELAHAPHEVVAFSVIDTGIGIPQDKHRLVFEAFQQADGTTSRKYGGTGLGLSISRELARLLGGEIHVRSEPGEGSVFTLYLPFERHASRAAAAAEQRRDGRPSSHAPKASPLPFDGDGQDRRARLLLFANGEGESEAVQGLIGASGVDTTAVGTADRALAALASCAFDCVVVETSSVTGQALDLLDAMASLPDLQRVPVIVHSEGEVSPQAEGRLEELGRSMALRVARTPERLLAEATSVLYGMDGPDSARQRTRPGPRAADWSFDERTVLIVDDDVRNLYALATVLEGAGMRVLFAENGADGIDTLASHPEVAAVVMDVMMPEMDGYETMRRIRARPEHQNLPVIALTAKAMKGDREKCLAAGASDYVTKPVDPDQLLELMRVWLVCAEPSP
jgi:signal transduction histidine kinase/CheY-like chemotaxis protein/HAMP domain-containing protein